MNDQQNAKMAARMLHDINRAMGTVSEFMYQNDLNLENYPENWNSFDEMASMLSNVMVFSENDSNVQEMVGEN